MTAQTITRDNFLKMSVSIRPRDLFFEDAFFENSWPDFAMVREAMFKEPHDLWEKFDADFRSTACMVGLMNKFKLNEKEDPLDVYKRTWMFPRRWMKSSLDTPLPSLFTIPGDTEVIRVIQDVNSLEVTLDTSMYLPTELEVKVDDGMICIYGKHEEVTKNGKRIMHREFSRKYKLPIGCRAEDVISNLSSDGVLVVSAGYPPAIRDEPQSKIK